METGRHSQTRFHKTGAPALTCLSALLRSRVAQQNSAQQPVAHGTSQEQEGSTAQQLRATHVHTTTHTGKGLAHASAADDDEWLQVGVHTGHGGQPLCVRLAHLM